MNINPIIESYIDKKLLSDFSVGLICAVHKNSYLVYFGGNPLRGELSGRMQFSAESALDYPTVGDYVYFQITDDQTALIIHELIPRYSVLKRKVAGKQIDYQLLGANIDIAFIMQSLDQNFNINRLDRYLVMINEAGITPRILLSKADLQTEREIEQKIILISESYPDVEVIAFSNVDRQGLNSVKNMLVQDQTYCLLGSSGVGKTTLLNQLIGKNLLVTEAVRDKDGRGRHTTSARQLIFLANGARIIDTPGMRELGNFGNEQGLSGTFAEIESFAENCRFKNCSHEHEIGCAVLNAVANGELAQQQFDNYLKMRREAAHYDRSYLEQRQRGKEFGKMYKAVMKEWKKARH